MRSLLIVAQYAYSILSILSGIVALLVTIVITTVSGAISLARLDFRKIPIEAISKMMEPSFRAFCAALMMDHDNTNPIKFTALEWFCDRLQTIRKAEVHQRKRSCCCYCALSTTAQSTNCNRFAYSF
jgi:dsRNA-specific ribonuclease